MSTLTNESLKKLVRKAGIKSISIDCYNQIRGLVDYKLQLLLSGCANINTPNSKTLTIDHLSHILSMNNEYICYSENMGKTKLKKTDIS